MAKGCEIKLRLKPIKTYYRRLQLSLNGPIANVIKHDVKLDLTDL